MDVEYCNKPVQPDQVEIYEMKYLHHGIVECIQESCIMIQYGIMNRFVDSFYKETSIISFVCIWLSMYQNSRQWIFLNNFIVTCFGVWQQALVLKLLYRLINDILILIR